MVSEISHTCTTSSIWAASLTQNTYRGEILTSSLLQAHNYQHFWFRNYQILRRALLISTLILEECKWPTQLYFHSSPSPNRGGKPCSYILGMRWKRKKPSIQRGITASTVLEKTPEIMESKVKSNATLFNGIKCHVQPFLKHFPWRWLRHLPEQDVWSPFPSRKTSQCTT